MTARSKSGPKLESRTIQAQREGRTADDEARYQIYTDGGARPNPGPGGWGVVILDRERGASEELSGGEPDTTNNRMELTAAIEGLEHLPQGADVEIHTDSTYVRQGITRWIQGWMARNWKRKVGKNLEPVKNEDLWRRLVDAEARHRVRWHWLKGHAGHEHNERADELATEAIARIAPEGAPEGGAGEGTTADGPPQTEAVAWLKVRASGRRGAWGALLLVGEEQTLLIEPTDGASANRLELEAGLAVLRECPASASLTLHAGDYLRLGATQWILGWKQRGWRTKAGDAVKNRDLWESLDAELDGRRVAWRANDPKHPAAKELNARVREEMKGT